MVLGLADIHMQKSEGVSLLQSYTKLKSKWINNVNIRATTIELLEENLGENFNNHGFGDECLDMTSKASVTKEK